MLDTAAMRSEICTLIGRQRVSLSDAENQLVEYFRQITDQERGQVLRLMEALTLHPETE
ncbi:hypothetical protein CFBP6411_05455 [Pseudomonas syringae group genomosp. 3]|uniref:Uncharacterized protein n=1 Tax=Pseudomonas syringae group genomosp. 3 TaxID=251701 RepID=A0A2K4WLN6_9PSED|nr:hypothetical protein CFBP6411_05455 [Pseudomonas syringae group genomosp. 3]